MSFTPCYKAYFVLFEVIFLKFYGLSSKPVFFTKLAISLLLAKFDCANLAAKCSAVKKKKKKKKFMAPFFGWG